MNKFEDFATAWINAFPSSPFDPKSVLDITRKSTETTEALTSTALKAAESFAEQTGKWTLESLARTKGALKVGKEPTEIANATKEWASASVESASEHFAAYTEIAKRAQIESAEIVLGATK